MWYFGGPMLVTRGTHQNKLKRDKQPVITIVWVAIAWTWPEDGAIKGLHYIIKEKSEGRDSQMKIND